MGTCLSTPGQFHLSPQFEILQKLGQGAQGTVYSCRDMETNSVAAVKLIKTPITDWQSVCLTREVQLQSQLVHVGIVRLRKVLLSSSHLGLVMDICAGGSLADHCRRPIGEEVARFYMHQLLPAVGYMHQHRVVHRDLKLDNVLMDMQNPPLLKLCDFGVAKRWGKRSTPAMRTIAGTPAYVAPDVLEGAFMDRHSPYDGTKADVWSLGVMLCYMLMGYSPFGATHYEFGQDQEAELRRVWNKAKLNTWSQAIPPAAKQIVSKLSPECKDFLNKAFTRDAKKRPSVEELMQHPWYKKGLSPQHQACIDNLQRQQRQLQKSELCVPSGELNDQLVARQLSSNLEALAVSQELLHCMGEARKRRTKAGKREQPSLVCIHLDSVTAGHQVQGQLTSQPLPLKGHPSSGMHSSGAQNGAVHPHSGPPMLTRQPTLSVVRESKEEAVGPAGGSPHCTSPAIGPLCNGEVMLRSPFENCAPLDSNFGEYPSQACRTPPREVASHGRPIIAPVKLSALEQHASNDSTLPSISSFPFSGTPSPQSSCQHMSHLGGLPTPQAPFSLDSALDDRADKDQLAAVRQLPTAEIMSWEELRQIGQGRK